MSTRAAAPNVENQLSAGDVARAKGGKVVALTIPKPFGIRLSFARRLRARRPARLGARDDAPRATRSWRSSPTRPPAASSTRRPSRPDPMRGLADWTTKRIFDVVADENQQYVGRTIGEIADRAGPRPVRRAVRHRARRRPAHQLRPRRPDLDRRGVEAAPRGVARRPGRHRRVRRRRPPRPARHVQLRDRAARRGRPRAQGLLPLEEAVHLITDVPARLYGLRRPRPPRGRPPRRHRRDRPRHRRHRRRRPAHRPPRRRRPASTPAPRASSTSS